MSPPQNGLKWTEDIFDIVPTWTVEPDIQVAKDIAQRYLPPDFEYEISSFASGAFNKLYLLSPVTHDTQATIYIMRVALPVDPHFKTASEVATLEYIHQYTTIPVPRVVAYDTSAENELGFEWILMTRLEGVPLKQLWASPKLSWQSRVEITTTVAGYIKQLKQLQCDKMGSLYFKEWNRPNLHWLETGAEELGSSYSDQSNFVPLEGHPEFVIGPVVSIPFFYGNRIKLPSDRGPFDSSATWITALLNLQIASTSQQKASLSADDDDYDSDDISDLDTIVEVSQRLLSMLPTFFPSDSSSGKEEFVLYHDDLSTNNILVDPITHRVTGLVDWECVSLQPQWMAQKAPQFLYGPEIDAGFYELNFGGPLPDVPAPPDESEGDAMLTELRERVEQMLLRRVLDGVLSTTHEQSERHRRIFENKLRTLETSSGRVSRWVKKVEEGGSPESEEQPGIGLYLWLDD